MTRQNGIDDTSPGTLRPWQGTSLRALMRIYQAYCRLLYPLYRHVKVLSLDLHVAGPHIMPPLSGSERLLFDSVSGKRVLDVGTGCGVLALLALQRGAHSVVGTDLDAFAIANARGNLERNFRHSTAVVFRQTDAFEGVEGTFDLIVSNPPYFRMPAGKTIADLKYCGDGLLERVLAEGRYYLRDQGQIRVLYPAAHSGRMAALARNYGYTLVTPRVPRPTGNVWLKVLLGHTVRRRLDVYVFRPVRADGKE
jgi:SAM-dependent methyltransferase